MIISEAEVQHANHLMRLPPCLVGRSPEGCCPVGSQCTVLNYSPQSEAQVSAFHILLDYGICSLAWISQVPPHPSATAVLFLYYLLFFFYIPHVCDIRQYFFFLYLACFI